MDYKESQGFRNYNLLSYVKVHRKIFEKMQKIDNPMVSGAIDAYGKILKQLETVVMMPASRYFSEWNVERARAYRICKTAVRSLAEFNSNQDRETVTELSRAFSRYISGASSPKITTAIEYALAVSRKIPVEQLEKLAIKERIDYMEQVHHNYLRSTDAIKNNIAAAKNDEVKIYRHCCDVAFRNSLELTKKMNSLGDESCQEFLRWMSAA
ncbi:hypothetical protein BGX12_15214 [Fibrobacter sp. UWR4]|nr:hypothetical protein BGX12_15214 [Fibrobacter sp. UWR4]PZW62768.1 hypothetical protein C8E88_105414 [Fibrobacter sp. UWR1]